MGLRNTSEQLWDLPSAGSYLECLSVQIIMWGHEQETAEGFEAVGSQLGAWKGKCSIFLGAAVGLLAMGGHCLQNRFNTSAPQLFSPVL